MTLVCLKRALFVLLFLTTAFARPPEEAEFVAAQHLGEEVAGWVDGIEFKPNSVSIFSVQTHAPLEQDFGVLVENEIIKSLSKKGFDKVTSCAECRLPTVTVMDDKVIIARGAPDVEKMKQAGRTQNAESFMMVDVYRTNLSLYAQVSLYANPSGILIGSEKFRIAAINYKDASVQVLIEFGGGKVLSGKGANSSGTSLLTSFNLLLLEELGFAKGGLNLGGIVGGSTLFYLNPTLAFRGRFGVSMMGYQVQLGVGYGLTGEAKGFALRGAYDVFLGTVAVVGVEASYFVPDQSGVQTLNAFGGFHVGLAFGR